MEGGKPENPGKNPRSKAKTNKKLNPHETSSTGIEPGSQRWEASSNPLRQSCSLVLYNNYPGTNKTDNSITEIKPILSPCQSGLDTSFLNSHFYFVIYASVYIL